MKLCKTEDLKENDVIASQVLSNDYQVLLSEGTVLKRDYIEKLKDFRIKEVYIQEKVKSQEEKKEIVKQVTEELLKEKVKNILEQHTYQHNQELMELIHAADTIISDILEEEKMVEEILDIKERSADIYEHSLAACTISIIVALKLKLSMKQVQDIAVGALLHDLGLRYLTISYENKNINNFSDFEKIEFKKHPVYAYTALKDESWISEESKNIILYHHEKLDGSGFPLRSTAVSLEAQVVAVCETFDEMISGIACERVKVYEAIEYLKIAKGKFYNEKVVEALLKIMAVFPIGSVVLLNDGRMAVVLKQNNQFPERPVLVHNRDGEEEIIDLIKETSLYIERTIQ